ncbi:major capsid protein [Agrococcus pavilionensis]|uniref:major capsid protein n=1 Tax=Agrococcus pavilionensis TaxID=1346502 RepID=UPI000390A286|nr:major capsid protein [Agrococcus pavilionensis]
MPTANAAAYPLAAPTVSGSTITVEQMLQQPTRITRYLSDLSLRNYISPLFFSAPGGVTGGAVVYDQLTLNDLFPTRDVQEVAPGAEFPIVTSENGEPKVASVEKHGGKFFVTDEARDRNDEGVIQREGRKLINAMIRRQDARAIQVVDAAISAFGSQTVTGLNWGAVVTGGSSQSNASAWPAADFSKVQELADTQELGVNIDTWVLNPAQLSRLRLVYGSDFDAVAASYGLTFQASNRVAAGTAYALERGQVGEIRVEKPLTTETIPERQTQRTWVQVDSRFVQVVTNPFSVFKVTGLAG